MANTLQNHEQQKADEMRVSTMGEPSKESAKAILARAERAGPRIDAQPLRVEYATANIPKGTRDDDFPIEPFEDCVYIEPFEEQVSKGGILIAHTKESKMPQGRVVAVGPGRFYFAAMNASQTMQAAIFVPTRIKVGDVVVWGRYATGGEPLEYNGKRYVAAREGDLGGIIVGGKMIDLRVVRQSGD